MVATEAFTAPFTPAALVVVVSTRELCTLRPLAGVPAPYVTAPVRMIPLSAATTPPAPAADPAPPNEAVIPNPELLMSSIRFDTVSELVVNVVTAPDELVK